jgi:hypothetical protein
MKLTTAILALAGTALVANAAVVDFSGTPSGEFVSYYESGATFTAVGGGNLTSDSFGNTPNGTRGLIANPFDTIRVDFDSAVTTVSVDMGDFNADSDDLYLTAFDSSGNVLDSDTLFIDASFTGMVTLSVNSPGIAYVTFVGVGFNGESNIYADNFTFDIIPTPSAAALLGLSGLVATRRRR